MTYIAPQAKLFEHLDKLQQIRANGMTDAPINVEIDLSNRCSLGCEWCHFAYTHTRGPLKGKRAKPAGAVSGGDLMDTAFALDLIDQLEAAGVRSVTWTGGGEPTLHPQFDKIILHAKDKVTQGIYTHGGHIDFWRAKLMKGALQFVYVSLDAANPDAYLRDKGVDRFDAACAGIRRLVAVPGDATIGVGFLVTPTNWRDVSAMAELGKRFAPDYIQFRPAIQYDNADVLVEDTGWIDDAIGEIQAVKDNQDNVEADLSRFEMYRDWNGHDYSTCWWSTLQTVITPNGKMWSCVNKREHADAEIGDLTTEPFASVWSRHTAAQVSHDCRIMCRGHLANQALAEIAAHHPHPDFV